tara:strand:- start:262 stop:576 length:315 start_codon:yes stop_codon:yes gene_type:complete
MSIEISKIVKGFDWNRVSWKDKEYLSNMLKETINSRSVNCSGIPFNQKYPGAGDFALFNNEQSKNSYKNEFYHSGEVASHLLTPHPKGRKYWIVWGYSLEEVNV